jgi:Tfp pilus assembly protein PilE
MTTPPVPQTSTPAKPNTPPVDTTTPLIAAFVGRNWSSHYKAAWEKLGSPTGLRGGTSWNWPAALFTSWWLLYRRQYLFWIGVVVASAFVRSVPLAALPVWFVSIIVFGMYGDRIVLSRAYKAVDEAVKQHGPGEAAKAAVKKAGGTNGLILLLPAVLIVGILAAIAIPKFAQVKQRAYVAVLISDLTSLVAFEEKAFATNSKYTDDLAAFVPSTDVPRPGISLTGDSSGFVATVRHPSAMRYLCAVAVNMPNPVEPRAASGQPVCK